MAKKKTTSPKADSKKKYVWTPDQITVVPPSKPDEHASRIRKFGKVQ